MTPRQKELLDFIRRHIAVAGVAPTYDEMAAGLGVTSKAGVSRMLDELERQGEIRRTRKRSRAIELVSHLSNYSDADLIAELRARGYVYHHARKAGR